MKKVEHTWLEDNLDGFLEGLSEKFAATMRESWEKAFGGYWTDRVLSISRNAFTLSPHPFGLRFLDRELLVRFCSLDPAEQAGFIEAVDCNFRRANVELMLLRVPWSPTKERVIKIERGPVLIFSLM